MIIQKIYIEGFKSFYDGMTLDFSDIQGFWKITGNIGAGKTTIGEAIIFGLFGSIKDKTNGDLLSWGKKAGVVDIWCSSKGHNIYIHRPFKKTGSAPLEVVVDDEPLVFTNKRDAQGQLENEYYDVTRMTLELLCIISFNNFKSISTLNTADTRKFLDQVFGFSIITEYAEAAKRFRNDAKDTMNATQQEININNAQITKIKMLSQKSIIEGNIDELKAEMNKCQDEANELTQKYKEYQQGIQIKQQEISSKLAVIKQQGGVLKKEIDFIKQGICPTCGAPIDQSALPDKEKQRQLLLDQYKEVNANCVELNELMNKATASYNKKYADLTAPIPNLNSKIAQLIAQSKRAEVDNEEVIALEKSNEQLAKKLVTDEVEYNEWCELLDALTGEVRPAVLGQFIPAINDSIAKYMNKMSQPYIITFNNEFECSVQQLGIDAPISLSSISTGQLKIVDIVIILGILDVLLHNINFNIMFLDELMSNIDADTIAVVCKVLQENCKNGQTLFIINHHDMDNNWFDGTIYASLKNDGNLHRTTTLEIVKNSR